MIAAACGAGGLAAAAVWCGPGASAHCRPLARALRIPLSLRSRPGVTLSFDDGPHPEGTPAVLGALANAGVRATFFLVGEQVERHPALARGIAAAGHEVAVHGYRHRNQMRLAPGELGRDLDRAVEVIGDTCGVSPRYYRPPYGVFTPVGLKLVRSCGLAPLLWSRWALDWRGRLSPAQLTARATRGARPGDVVLLHDADWYSHPGAHRVTVQAVPRILAELDRLGLAG